MQYKTTRRKFIGGMAAAITAPAILKHTRAYAADPVIKIGHVSPRTGPIAGFAEADEYVLKGIQAALSGGVENNGKKYAIEIISKDSQSNPNRAAEVAADLILGDEVDIIVAASTPDTTNPVADQAEVNEIPCITTDCPWQPYFFGRNGNPAEGFDYTYHFFWGLEDVIGNFTAMWESSGAEKTVAGLFPNDADGNATFWSQAAQQGFNPKVVTIGKALLFPSVIESLGDRGDGLTSEIWWTPSHPFSSSLTGDSAKALADGYTAASGRPWTQPIGFKHALFEVVKDVVSRASDLDDPSSIVDAIKSTSLSTVVGNVDWSKGPVPNVTKTPLVAGQWQKQGDAMELVITNNSMAPEIPLGGELKLLG